MFFIISKWNSCAHSKWVGTSSITVPYIAGAFFNCNIFHAGRDRIALECCGRWTIRQKHAVEEYFHVDSVNFEGERKDKLTGVLNLANEHATSSHETRVSTATPVNVGVLEDGTFDKIQSNSLFFQIVVVALVK